MNKSLKIIGIILAGLAVVYLLFVLFWSMVFDARFENLALAAEARDKQAKYIIDADTANEVDDLFAIVGALSRNNRYNYDKPLLVGLTAAQFHTSPLAGEHTANESQTINEELLALMYGDVRSYPGSDSPMASATEAEQGRSFHGPTG